MALAEPVGESGLAEPSSDAPWKLSAGQFIAVGLLLMSIVAQVVWGGISVVRNEADSRQLLNQETDVAGLTFIQRESFTVVQRLDSWALGLTTARDVQIARANLGQRLRVVTTSNIVTADLTTAEYRQALEVVDALIVSLPDVPEQDRQDFRLNNAEAVQEFDRQARALSITFQDVLDRQTATSIAQRQQSEWVYLSLLGLSVGLLALVAIWVLSDIRHTYRRTSNQLTRERKELAMSRQRLLLISRLEEGASGIADFIKARADAPLVRAKVQGLVSGLLPHDQIRFVSKSGRPGLRSVGSDPSVAPEDRRLVFERADELLSQLFERDANEATREFLASHDDLTGLKNRNAYTAELRRRAENERVASTTLLVIAIDVDRFGEVNSAFGFEAGDHLLKNVAERVQELVGDEGWAARVAADEFAIVSEAPTKKAAQKFAQRVHDAMQFPLELGETQSRISCTTAALWAGQVAGLSGDLVEQVGGVLHLAKEQGDGAHLFFDPKIHRYLGADWLNDLELQRALTHDEFVVYFQPIIALPSEDIAGFEALVRWEKPGFEVLMPGQFLPGIGRAGLTLELGAEIVEHSLSAWKRSLRTLNAESPPYVSINVDPRQLGDATFADMVLSIARQLQVPAEYIVIEVTEQDITEGELALAQLERLRAHGARVAVDDFGTGYSNLSQLHKLPVDIVKLDRSFLQSVESDDQSYGLIADIVQLAGRLGLTVIAEGIETLEMSRQLTSLGVTHGQGYLFSAAVPERDIKSWVHSRHADVDSQVER